MSKGDAPFVVRRAHHERIQYVVVIAARRAKARERGDSMRTGDEYEMWEAIRRLIAENRDRCLWFLAPDFQPTNRDSAVRALQYIERYGDKVAYEQARELRLWLQQPSRSNSAD